MTHKYPLRRSLSHVSVGSEEAAHRVFRATCALTGPGWTLGDSDPTTWRAAEDADGVLCLWDHHGDFVRVEPPTVDPESTADNALFDLTKEGAVIGIVRASYVSSGRMVALCERYGHWRITQVILGGERCSAG